jgi:hypothetical protein
MTDSLRPDPADLLDEVLSLAQACLDKELTAAEAQRLEQLLHDHAAARKIYLRFMQDSVAVQTWAEQSSVVKLPASEGRWTRLVGWTFESVNWRRHPVQFIAASALVTVVAWWCLVVLVWPRDPRPVIAQPSKPTPSQQAARLTGQREAQWADPSLAPRVGGRLHIGQLLELEQGLAEITFDDGARVILEGPAIFRIATTDRGDLQQGKLTARLAGESRGFAIDTPLASIVDLGTEFGVAVEKSGRADVVVYEGLVELTAGPGDPTKPRGRSIQLSAGQRATVDSNGKILTPDDSTPEAQLVRTLPPQQSPADRSAAYAAYVQSLGPTVYYRMEDATDNRLLDSGESQSHLTLHRSEARGKSLAGGRVGTALNLRGPQAPTWALAADYPKSATGRITVAAWVMAHSRPQWAMIAANWGDEKYGQLHFGLYGDTGVLSAQIGHEDGSYVVLPEETLFPIGSWQHVAFTADGSTLRLYRNGRQVGVKACSRVNPEPALAALGIGCKSNDADGGLSAVVPACWHGGLDEIAIFDRALSAGEVQALYRKVYAR